MSKPHFDDFPPQQRTWFINHLVGLMYWAKEVRPDLLDQPHELLNFYYKYAVLPPGLISRIKHDLHLVAACHHFLEDYADKLDHFPDFKEYRPKLSWTPMSKEQREFLNRLIEPLSATHPAKELNLDSLDSKTANKWIDHLRRRAM